MERMAPPALAQDWPAAGVQFAGVLREGSRGVTKAPGSRGCRAEARSLSTTRSRATTCSLLPLERSAPSWAFGAEVEKATYRPSSEIAPAVLLIAEPALSRETTAALTSLNSEEVTTIQSVSAVGAAARGPAKSISPGPSW